MKLIPGKRKLLRASSRKNISGKRSKAAHDISTLSQIEPKGAQRSELKSAVETAMQSPSMLKSNLSVPNFYQSCLAEEFRSLPKEEREARLLSLSPEESVALLYDWDFWARPNQRLPEGNWTIWMVKAGRGFGKTRIGSETVRRWVREFPLVNFIGATADDARDIMIEGESGILAICPKDERPLYIGSKRQLIWPNGSRSLIFTADEPERLRGKQHYKLWCDEVAAWRYPESWDQAMFGLRLGDKPQAVVTTTPKPTPLIKELVKNPGTHLTEGSTYENRSNLADNFFTRIITKYEGTRLGRQELNAELLEDNPGALWRLSAIDSDRVCKLPDLRRVVVGVDPAVTSTDYADETGIVVCGTGPENPPHYYVLDDRSKMASPDDWAQIIVSAYHQHNADRVIAETNNGGDLVEGILRTKDLNFAYKAVHASRGKIVRAEPIAALYEQHRVHHVGTFGQLEDQMCDYDPAIATKSPDRMDALVWALTELSEASGALGLVDSMLKQQDEINKVQASKLIKPVTSPETQACPECGSKAIVRIGGNRQRCNQCGAVSGDAVQTAGAMTRKEYLAK